MITNISKIFLLLIVISGCSTPKPKEPSILVLDIPEYCERYNKDEFLEIEFVKHHVVSKAWCLNAPDVIDTSLTRVFYSLLLENVYLGEKIKATVQTQFTNDTPKPVMLSWYWVMALTPWDYEGDIGLRQMGENFDNHIVHHKHIVAIGAWESEMEGQVFLNFSAYAASGEAEIDNSWIRHDGKMGYSTLIVERE